MKGSIVYLMLRKSLNTNDKTIIALHKTPSGAHNEMLVTREYWESVGATIKPAPKGFIVDFGQNQWHYYVIGRTILD